MSDDSAWRQTNSLGRVNEGREVAGGQRGHPGKIRPARPARPPSRGTPRASGSSGKLAVQRQRQDHRPAQVLELERVAPDAVDWLMSKS